MIHLFVNDNVGQTSSYNTDVTADANGTFTKQFQLPASFVAIYTVTATGAISGTATMSFTDASTLFAAAPSGVSFDLTYQGFQDATCATPVNGTAGTVRHQTVTAGSNFDPNANPNFWKLTAGNASAPAGATFSTWATTGGGSFSTLSPSNVICATSAGSSNNFIYTATYTTVQGTSLTVASASGTYGSTVNLTATLTSSGTGVSGKSIGFTLNGVSVGSATTNRSGVATRTGVSLSGINVGTYNPGVNSGVAASFAGDSTYTGDSGSNTLTVSQAASTTTVTCPATVTYAGSAQTPCSATVTGAGGLNQSLTVSYSNNTNAGPHRLCQLRGRCQPHRQQRLEDLHDRQGQLDHRGDLPCGPHLQRLGADALLGRVTGAGGLNQSLTVSYTDNTNAGTATATASFAGDANHTGSNDSKTFPIDKASSTTAVTCPAGPSPTTARR